MLLRTAAADDLEAVTELEAACFPKAEAATREEFAERLAHYADCFQLLFDEAGSLVSFIDGLATNEPDLADDMYADAGMHNPDGCWQMIFGLNTHPNQRKKGYAGMLVKAFIDLAQSRGKRGLVLTCKDHLVHYYARFGFADEGTSSSTHGNVVWHQMRLTFQPRP